VEAQINYQVIPGQSKTLLTPNCSTPESPIPSPSSSPIGKIGDINNDGKVNIFDFNIFVGDYPSKNIRSDVNKDGVVNIFDFNQLLSNFGK
jgi:hypothetical protein